MKHATTAAIEMLVREAKQGNLMAQSEGRLQIEAHDCSLHEKSGVGHWTLRATGRNLSLHSA